MLEFTAFFSYLALLLLAYIVGWVVYTRTLHPLAKVPGPFWASVSRVWYTYHVNQGRMEHMQREMHRIYGPLVRITPDEIACADPDAFRKIYPIAGPLTKTEFYPPWGETNFSKYPNHFAGTDERLHSERRRIVNNAYSMSTVLTLEAYLDNCSALFIQRMGDYADSGAVVDFGEWLQWYAFDVIGELFFGKMFGFMKKSSDHESYIGSLDALMPFIVATAVSSKKWRSVILASALFSSKTRSALKALDHIAEAAKSCVTTRQTELAQAGGAQSRGDLLQLLLNIMTTKGKSVDFGTGEVETEAYVALFAGSDTTAIAMRSIFYHLMKHPEAWKKLQAEVDDATAAGQLSDPYPRFKEAQTLPYLSAVIKEAMRLHPSVGLTMPRFTPSGGLELAGTHIPAGWKVGMNAAVIGYDERIYGADTSGFRPERWLGDPAQTAIMDKYNLVFGAGTRTCIGKNISLSEIHKLVPLVMRNFTFVLDDPAGEWRTHNLWFNKQTGINIRVFRRGVKV